MARIKLGVTLQGSKGHSDRINGKPPQAYWGVSMSFHCTFSLDKCTLDVALKRLRIYELLNLLGLYPFLIDANHEVILSASCSFLRGSECSSALPSVPTKEACCSCFLYFAYILVFT